MLKIDPTDVPAYIDDVLIVDAQVRFKKLDGKLNRKAIRARKSITKEIDALKSMKLAYMVARRKASECRASLKDEGLDVVERDQREDELKRHEQTMKDIAAEVKMIEVP